MIRATAIQPTANCPACRHLSRRIHSWYLRSPKDVPTGEHAVRLRLHVRRFRCVNPRCRQRTFAERLPHLVPFRAQRTGRLTERLQALSFALSAEAGARLARRLQMTSSPDTLLRLVRQTPIPDAAPPHVVGVDEFALRKGRRYATVVVDLEHRCPLDVLPERTAESLIRWLQQHPTVQILARDRSHEYARGATLGAPQALQVADRWHLLHNLRELVERVVLRRRAQLRRLPRLPTHAGDETAAREDGLVRPRRLRRATESEHIRQQESRTRRLSRYDMVHALLAQGLSQRRIAHLLGISRTIVRQFVHADRFPERAVAAPTPSTIDPYLAYLHERWQAGCHNSQQLWREIRAHGYPNGPRQVMRWAAHQRTEPAPSTPNAYRQNAACGSGGKDVDGISTVSVPMQLGAPRDLVRLLLRAPETLTALEQRELTYIVQDRQIGALYELAQQFQRLLRRREPAGLEDWLATAMASPVPELQAFAVALHQDRNAVQAALREEWSNGQVEGQITRIKFIKRRMYGRANFDLLRQHILCGN